ncbi:hypothetical protein IKE98_02615 [Candidatus Saccharibacteria bacterium]|nr:hypothetical protein [Candidatus Saccharibacteria bacterium]
MTIQEQREIILSKLSEEERQKRIQYLEESDFKVAKMRTRLKTHYTDLGLMESIRAFNYMCEVHGEQIRKNGEQYIIHPMSMACRIMTMRIIDDHLSATHLLHDSIEPEDRYLRDDELQKALLILPVNDSIRYSIGLMTITATYENEPVSVIKRRYFQRFIERPTNEHLNAIITKANDRNDNLRTLTNLNIRSILKNILETNVFFLPNLKTAEKIWPEHEKIIHDFRERIEDIIRIHVFYNKVENPYDEEELIRLLDDPNYLK